MSEELLRKLRFLEEDYSGMPPAVRQADLQEINRIRSQLGKPMVDDLLNEITVADESVGSEEIAEEETEPESEESQDHSEARAIYETYLKKVDVLKIHMVYADQVARATNGSGQTPVRPLATMGTGGGPLLCDHCGKPIVLEGGNFHGMAADVAWKQNPNDNWTSWILGGMVVEIETNKTLRIYHGYPGSNPNHCCNIASRKDEKARAEFGLNQSSKLRSKMLAFVEQEFSGMTEDERTVLLNDILDKMCSYDPGIGINRPPMNN